MLALWFVIACSTAPGTIEGCATLDDAADREDCRWAFIEPLKNDPKALAAALNGIDAPGSRDLALLRLAIGDPQKAGRYCRQVQTNGAREKCQQVLGRPHLSSGRRKPQ